MVNPYRAFRQLERKIFRGVPEAPESIYERDFSSQAPECLSGRSQFAEGLPLGSVERFPVVAVVTYRLSSGEIVVQRESCVPVED